MTESALANADGYASEPVAWAPWKARKPSAQKIFIAIRTFLVKRGWVLRWEGLSRLYSSYNALKDRFGKM